MTIRWARQMHQAKISRSNLKLAGLVLAAALVQGCSAMSGSSVAPPDNGSVKGGVLRPNLPLITNSTIPAEPPAKSPALPASTGPASWYGPGFTGKKTASGDIFDDDKLTAAHKTLPFGSKAKVTNLSNGKWVKVEINDRGPFVGNRIIDLSQAAAHALGMIDRGVVQVKIEPLVDEGDVTLGSVD